MLVPGSVVRCRERDWVLMPGCDQSVFLLRPLAGGDEDIVGILKDHSNLIGYELSTERVEASSFPLPEPHHVADAESARLLWDAARLNLREAAAPFRSLGRVSLRPRVYQFVPLLMALKLNPVRLFIADDVGVGKTIEALLVARELLDRGEITSLCVLCPPYLCDQWEQELRQKFHIEAEVVRSGTIGQLERRTPASLSIYKRFPFTVASIDFVKTERNRHQFLEFCPDLIIVDEVHGAAESSDNNRAQQERHRLLREVARKTPERHLILLTATPHSGIEQAFSSLLRLLNPEFESWDTSTLSDSQRTTLARHFVQRTRGDIKKDWLSRENSTDLCFPERESFDVTYTLSAPFSDLYNRTYDFCRSIVLSGSSLAEHRRRFRYLGALSLLRSVMSSPAAAVAAVEKALERRVAAAGEEPDILDEVMESSEQTQWDEVVAAEPPDDDRFRDCEVASTLRELRRRARHLRDGTDDSKMLSCAKQVRELLGEDFSPIVWCRFVDTAEYVAELLRHHLSEEVHVCCVTGRMPDDERRARIEEIPVEQPHVLVATDCLSEGINLQEKFNACVHYDLPWNPNRLEQREGRVDRYGQFSPKVRAILLYGQDNPVDGAVLRVIVRKAQQIHRALGTYVPVPADGKTLAEALANALFFSDQRSRGPQLSLELSESAPAQELHREWDREAERERQSRTRFAQRSLKPEEVERELRETDDVLGHAEEVRLFVLAAAQRLQVPINPSPRNTDVYHIPLDNLTDLPEPVRLAMPEKHRRRGQLSRWTISFRSPTPEGAEYVGRNHPFVQAIARYLMERALTGAPDAEARRCGAVLTSAVSEPTVLLLLRPRYRVSVGGSDLLWEEVLCTGWTQSGFPERWLQPEEARQILKEAQATGNLTDERKRELLREVLRHLPGDRIGNEKSPNASQVGAGLRTVLERRAEKLLESHRRIRKELAEKVKGMKAEPLDPPDILAILVLQPEGTR